MKMCIPIYKPNTSNYTASPESTVGNLWLESSRSGEKIKLRVVASVTPPKPDPKPPLEVTPKPPLSKGKAQKLIDSVRERAKDEVNVQELDLSTVNDLLLPMALEGEILADDWEAAHRALGGRSGMHPLQMMLS